jgi:hypothetical protein
MPFFGSLRKGSSCFGLILKASMVGFTLLSRSYYYLRRRSPGPPFPPDHRQAGERGATTHKHGDKPLMRSMSGFSPDEQ